MSRIQHVVYEAMHSSMVGPRCREKGCPWPQGACPAHDRKETLDLRGRSSGAWAMSDPAVGGYEHLPGSGEHQEVG